MHVSRICSDLVKIKSENPPGRTDGVIEYIRSFLDGIGVESRVSGNSRGMCNLVTPATKHRLILAGHVDVVPARDAAWKYPPFSGRIDKKYVHGRGSTDMKGGCASILSACRSLADEGREIPATLLFVCDEETGGEHGIRRVLADRLIVPSDCLIAEPTPCRHPAIGQKGLFRLELSFTGIPAHGSLYPAVGLSAIMEAVALIEYVRTLPSRNFPISRDLSEILDRSAEVMREEFKLKSGTDILRHLTYNAGTIRGGEKSNVVAEHCVLELEMRVPWGCPVPELKDGIMAVAKNAEIVLEESHDPSMTDPAGTLVKTTCEEIRTVWGGEVFPFVQWAASDARHLRAHGFNVLEYGPGEIPTLHAVNERVTIESLEKAALVYRGIMERYAGMDRRRTPERGVR
jgi:succinyl-diaminopimelate desuccinylase